MNLTGQQEEAAGFKGGSCVVTACPGSGKTAVAVERIRRLISSGLATWDSVVAVTFTNRAAGELLARIGGRLGYCGTTHGLALEVLKRATGLVLGLKTGFAVWDDEARTERLAAVIAYHRFKATPEAVAAYMDEEHCAPGKIARKNPCAFIEREEAAGMYAALKKAGNAEDYNGLIDRARIVLTANPGFLRELQDRWRHVTVDEYQDVDVAQDDLINLLFPARACRTDDPDRSVFVVGDPMQAIYGWRGGDPRLLDWRLARAGLSLRLLQNFRNPFDLAMCLERLGGPCMVSAVEGHSRIARLECRDEPEEDEEIRRLALKNPSATAVLCRTNGQAERIAGALAGHDILGGCISTIHLAKGLEWDTVILPGWSEGLFPSQQAVEAMAKGDPEPMAAERRLAYVALSRAKRQVLILSPRRISRGVWEPHGIPAAPSRFLKEMGLEVVGG